jgi:hypothetical protein
MILLMMSLGWTKYVVHVRRLWWLPHTFVLSAMTLLLIWRFALNMPLDSPLLFVGYYFIVSALITFAAQSVAGWWFWKRPCRPKSRN